MHGVNHHVLRCKKRKNEVFANCFQLAHFVQNFMIFHFLLIFQIFGHMILHLFVLTHFTFQYFCGLCSSYIFVGTEGPI